MKQIGTRPSEGLVLGFASSGPSESGRTRRTVRGARWQAQIFHEAQLNKRARSILKAGCMASGKGVMKGMLLTLQHVFKPPITVNYPEYQREVPVRARTNLIWFEERCTGCSTCAQACPDGCILVQTSPRDDGTLEIERYEIDFRICMYCGLCTEACPYQAIQAGGRYDDAQYIFENMYRNKETLTSEAQAYLASTDGRYPNGQTQDANPLITSMPTARSHISVAGADGPLGPQHLPSRKQG